MRALLLLVLAFAAVSATRGAEPSELLDTHLELATLGMQFGPAHPKVVAANAKLEDLKAAGVEIDPTEAESEFVRLFGERQQRLGQYGWRHPKVVLVTRKIRCLASILAGVPD